jgi:hypothetical protein
MKFRGPQALNDTLEFAFSLTSCRRRSPGTNRKDDPGGVLCAYATYPCQTCWPQAHCTVSVGTFLVNCCLQTGQGLVITYVITLFSLRARAALSKTQCTLRARRVVSLRTVLSKTRRSQTRPLQVCASKDAFDFVSANATTRSSSCGIRAGPWFGRFVAFAVNTIFGRAVPYLFCFQVRAIESCRDTAVAVAQIFSVASRKFRSLAASAL